jgi:glutathionylspermidine synthase
VVSAAPVSSASPLVLAGPPLEPGAFAAVRRRMIFDHCKWDPQVEDVSVLAPFPLVIEEPTWHELATLAESLAAETLAAEEELVHRQDLLPELALPRAFLREVRRLRSPLPQSPRVMRFDFHPTRDGWQISEVNSDVPGGFIESSAFPDLIADHLGGELRVTGDPASALCDAVAHSVPSGGTVGLVHATAYTDDRQVMVFLSRALQARGLRTCLISPDHLCWRDGNAAIHSGFHEGDADALIRFFPAEWLPNLPSRSQWPMLLTGGRTTLMNPGTALLTQSKRFPLVWDRMRTPLPWWRRLLPETRDPRDTNWRRDDGWVVKPVLGRVGDGIGIFGVTPQREWRAIRRGVRWFPRHWVAQKRFQALPIDGPDGQVFPCFGVYTVGGRAAGVYGRIASAPLINHLARDVAVLVRPNSHCKALTPRGGAPVAEVSVGR